LPPHHARVRRDGRLVPDQRRHLRRPRTRDLPQHRRRPVRLCRRAHSLRAESHRADSRGEPMTTVDEYAQHSAYSDPGAYAPLLDELPDGIPEITDAVRNVIIHYRSGVELPADRASDIDSRWVERILATDQERHGRPLRERREDKEKV